MEAQVLDSYAIQGPSHPLTVRGDATDTIDNVVALLTSYPYNHRPSGQSGKLSLPGKAGGRDQVSNLGFVNLLCFVTGVLQTVL